MRLTKKAKKYFCCLLVLCMTFSSVMITNAEETDGVPAKPANLSEREFRMEEILASYHEQVFVQESQATEASLQQNGLTLQEETVALLNEEGFDAYAVNDDTYEEVENTLNTDLEEIGVRQGYSYIIVLDGKDSDNGNAQIQSSATSSFNYTYNGTTYSLRRLTITAADDGSMAKASYVNLLTSSSKTLINNCLNTAIYAYIDFLSGPLHLGTVSAICGLNVTNFGTVKDSTLILHGATNWTRKYTQVWSNYDQKWLNGSCVEYVRSSSHMSGDYYNAATNSMSNVPDNQSAATSYSNYYSNTAWQNQYAVVGYLNSFIQYDTVGNVKYSYGGTVKITHYENF